MPGLIYKDYLVVKKELWLNLFVVAASSVVLFLPWQTWLDEAGRATEEINGATMTFILLPVLVYLFAFYIISGLQSNLISMDENSYYSAFVLSTPLMKRGQVLSKYYGMLILSFVGVLWGFVCDIVSSVVYGEAGSAMMIYVSIFFIQIFLRAVEVPFMIRFGHKNGKLVKIVLIVVVFFAVMIYILFGDLHNATIDTVVSGGINWLVNGNNMSNLMSLLLALFPYIAVLAYYVSYKISVKMYLKGAANFEK